MQNLNNYLRADTSREHFVLLKQTLKYNLSPGSGDFGRSKVDQNIWEEIDFFGFCGFGYE